VITPSISQLSKIRAGTALIIMQVTFVQFIILNMKRRTGLRVSAVASIGPTYHCHHTVGLAVYKKKAAYLDIHMEIPIGQTRATVLYYYLK